MNILSSTSFFFIFLSNILFSQITFEELDIQMAEKPKPVVIYLSSEPCAYCDIQEQQLKKNTELQKILTRDYYYLTLNSTYPHPIKFNNRIYRNIQKIHEFSKKYALNNGTYSFPTWIVFTENYQFIYSYHGLLSSRELLLLLSPLNH